MYHSPKAKDILHFIILFLFLAAVAAASHLRGEESHHDESRGLTSLLLQLPDPKSVADKSEIMNPGAGLPRPINILVLGGGHCRREEKQGFSSMLRTPNVDLIVYEYLSMCVDSTVPDVVNKNYDVILLNTNPNLEGFMVLLLCCKDRFPEAVIINMRTWSYDMLVQGEGTSLELAKIEMKPIKEALMTIEHGGHAYVMPRPKTVEEAKTWFCEVPEGHIRECLSNLGHQIVANGIGQLINDHQQEVMKPKQLGGFRLVSEQYLHPHANNCFWTPGESDTCINMLLQRIPKLAPRIRFFFFGDSTQRILSNSFIYDLNHANATYFFNRYVSNEDHVDKFMETQSCQSGDLCVCIVNSGFWDMKFTKLSDEEYIFNLRGYIQILRPFCKHLIWIPTSSTLDDPNYPQANQRTHIWNKLVANMLVSEPFDDWTSIVNSHKASTLFQHTDNAHLTGGYYRTLAKLFDEVDRMFSEVDGIQKDGTYLIFTPDKVYQDCNAVIHEKDQIKRIHHHMASCKHFDNMFGNRLAYMYGIRMIANALQKPFTFTCGMAKGERPNGAVHLMNLFTNIRGPVPHRANGEGYTAEDICQNICNNVFCSWHSRDLDLVAHTMAVDWRHLASPLVVPISDNDDAVIHLRLGDGLYSSVGTNEEKGVFPHKTYINLLMQAQQEKGTISSIGIVTAPFKGSNVRSFDVGYTSLSEEIALDLLNALQNAFPKAKISIHNSPEETIMESLARVVHARKVAVCGCSTFCPYPLLATEGIGFMYNPVGAQNQWVRNAAKRYDDFRLFETPMLNGLMIANDKTGWKLDHALVMDWVRHQDPNVGNVDIIEAPIFREPKP